MNKRKVIYKYLAVILISCVILQSFQGSAIAYAATSVVTGKNGATYNIPATIVSEFEINNGSITITDTGITQNGNTLGWTPDVNNGIVIKGTGSSTNTITISNTSSSAILNVYLVDLEWDGSIIFDKGTSNVTIVGEVINMNNAGMIGNLYVASNNNPSSKTYMKGLNSQAKIKTKYFVQNNVGISPTVLAYLTDFTLIDLNILCENLYEVGSKMVMPFKIRNLQFQNCNITSTGNSKSYLSATGSISINNTIMKNVKLGTNYYPNYSAATLTIADSELLDLDFYYKSEFYNTPTQCVENNPSLNISNSYVSGKAASMLNVSSYNALCVYNMTINNSYVNLPVSYSYAPTFSNSTVEFKNQSAMILTTTYASLKFVTINNSSVNSGKGVVYSTVKNGAGVLLYQKKIKLTGYKNKKVLATLNGSPVILYTDEFGYIYPYVETGSTGITLSLLDDNNQPIGREIVVTYSPVTGNDSQTYAPEINNGGGSEGGSSELKIIAQSGDKNLIVGYAADLFVAGNTEDIGYQWHKNGIKLEGESNSVLHISPTVTGSAIYTCTLKKEDKSLESQPITVTVVDNPLASEVADLYQITADLTNQVNSLTGQLESANSEKTALQGRVSDLENQITSLNVQVSELQNQMGILVQKLQDSQEENESLKKMIQDLIGQINTLNGQIRSIQGDLQLVNEQKSSLELAVIDLNNEINNLNGQISLLEGKLSASEGENAGLREQVYGLQDTISQMQDNISSLNSQVVSLTEENSSLHTQLDTANSTIQSLQNQIAALLQENASLKEQLSYAQEQIDELTEQLTVEQQKNGDLHTKLCNTLSQIDEIATQLGLPTADRQDILDRITAMKSEISSLNSQLKASNDSINSLNTQIQNLLEMATGLQHKIDAAMDSLTEYEGTELQDKINVIINENKSLSGQITELENQNSSLINQIASMNDTISSLLIQIGGLTDENTNLKNQLNQAEETINTLQEQLRAHINTNNDLQDKLSDLVSKMDDLQSQLTIANVEKEELLNQMNNLQSDIGTLTQQLMESKHKIDSLNQQIVSMNVTIKGLTDQVKDALDSLSEYEGNSLVEKIGDIKEKQTGLKNALEDANSRNSILNKQLADATGQLSYLQSEIDRLTGALQDKDAEIARLNALIKQKNDDNAALISRNADLESKNQNLQTENEQLKEQINQGNPGNSVELQKLRNQLKEKEKELATANSTIDSLKKQLANQSSGNTTNGTLLKDDEYVVVPETSSNKNLNEIVKESVINNSNQTMIESKDGWELSSSLAVNSAWGDTLDPAQDQSYTGVFTFFDNGLSSPVKQILSSKSIKKADILSFGIPSVGVVSQAKQLLNDSTTGNYAKYTFYARRVNEKNKIYVCEFNVKETQYISPVTRLTSSIMDEPRNFTPNNTYTKEADGNIVFRVSADYGDVGKGIVKYQIVPENQDFDSDGNWTEVSDDTFTVTKQKENFRVYVKYMDKAGNFTVDKTVGFKVATKEGLPTKHNTKPVSQKAIPVLTVQKMIELGHTYTINLANVTNKEKITFTTDNNKVAIVNRKGVITSKGVGNAKISGVVVSGNYTYKFIVKVNVVKGVYDNTLNIKPIATLDFSAGKPTLIVYKLCKKDESFRLNILDSEDAQIIYKSKDNKVATVSKTGIIKGIGKGRSYICVTVTKNGIVHNYMIIVRVDDGTKDVTMWDYLKAE